MFAQKITVSTCNSTLVPYYIFFDPMRACRNLRKKRWLHGHALASCMHAWWVLDSMVMQLCFELTQTSIAYNLSPHIYIYIYI